MTPLPDPHLRETLERAVEGLLYGSESDRPFDFFFLAGAGPRPPGAREFARLLGEPDTTRAEEWDLDRFFARHSELSDPYDEQFQRIRYRYEELRETLRRHLDGATVYRLGSIEVRCHVAGGDGRGNLAGISTIAIET